MPLFSGFSRVSTVPAGSIEKALLVGANTVNGPGLLSVSTSTAAFTAATSVVWSREFTALSMMSLAGYMGAPPTILLAGAAAMAPIAAAFVPFTEAFWSMGTPWP